jgi:pimeloyl-ACP methyl ester carboxylesterase
MTDSDPGWLDRDAYPFRSHFLETPQGRLHYVDEGEGDPILFVHGNPTWSFEHRRLISHLSRRYRCIAPDHIGFGLSDKPPAATYLPQMHAANFALLIERLGLDRITLVVHDWGGPISMAYAVEHPERVARIIAYNSWFWSVRGVKAFEQFSAFMGGPIGRLLCRNFNFFPRVVMKFAVGDKRSLPPHVHRQFTSVHRTRASRKGTWVFPSAIIGQSDWLETMWHRRERIADVPLLLLWGMKDVAMDGVQLARWESTFPNHETHRFNDVGHFVPEELGERAFPIVERFLDRHPP